MAADRKLLVEGPEATEKFEFERSPVNLEVDSLLILGHVHAPGKRVVAPALLPCSAVTPRSTHAGAVPSVPRSRDAAGRVPAPRVV